MFILNDIERQSAVWKKIKQHCEDEIARLRVLNDTSVDLARTERLRGRIKAFKYLAALDNPAPQAEADDE